MEKLKMQLEWFNHFADLIQHQRPNLYQQACEYADTREEANNE